MSTISCLTTCPFCNKHLSSFHNERYCMNEDCGVSIHIYDTYIIIKDHREYKNLHIHIQENYCIFYFKNKIKYHHNLNLNDPISIISIYNRYKKLELLQ